jgi:aryl-alcohol dehydrogenase-like predicted oxidoreductase
VSVTEDIIGRWLAARGRRSELVITTKVRARIWGGPKAGLTRPHISRTVDDSLRRLRSDHVDMLYARWRDPDAVIVRGR